MFSLFKMGKLIFAPVNDKIMQWATKEAERRLIGGISRLPNQYLEGGMDKRLEFQISSILGESIWHYYRYGNINILQGMLDQKFQHKYSGDNGIDDKDGIDVKCTKMKPKSKLEDLHLVVPKKEFHTDRFYVAAFYAPHMNHKVHGQGKGTVFLSGWAASDEVSTWPAFRLNPESYATKTDKLHPIEELRTYLTHY